MTVSTTGANHYTVRGFRARARQGPARAERSEHGRPRHRRPTAGGITIVCGDGIIDFETEECDDGGGTDIDLCSNYCQVTDTPVEVQDAEYPWV